MMEVLGHHDGVCSVSCSISAANVFVTAGEDACIQLWDTRLKKKNFMTFGGKTSSMSLAGIAEVLLDHSGSFRVAAACGNQLHAIDVRKPFGFCGSLTLPTEEDVSFLFDTHRFPRVDDYVPNWEILAADDNGALYRVETSLWELKDCGPQLSEGFGNLCCGMGLTANRYLWSVSMGGDLHGYFVESASSFEKVSERRYSGNISEIRLAQPSQPRQQLHNPPIPTCLTTTGSLLLIGRGDGTYSIYETASETADEILCAPAHQDNGLISLQWCDGILFTIALSGEITGWDISTFLAQEATESDSDLPDVTFASTIRQDPRGRHLVNCCDLTREHSLIVGDTSGSVTLTATR
jgi:WD40 repeat protein